MGPIPEVSAAMHPGTGDPGGSASKREQHSRSTCRLATKVRPCGEWPSTTPAWVYDALAIDHIDTRARTRARVSYALSPANEPLLFGPQPRGSTAKARHGPLVHRAACMKQRNPAVWQLPTKLRERPPCRRAAARARTRRQQQQQQRGPPAHRASSLPLDAVHEPRTAHQSSLPLYAVHEPRTITPTLCRP